MNLPLRMGVAATLAMILTSVPSRAEPAPTVPDATLDALIGFFEVAEAA